MNGKRWPRRMRSLNRSRRFFIVFRLNISAAPPPARVRLVDRDHRRRRLCRRRRGLCARRARAFPRHLRQRPHAVRRDAAQGAGRLPDRRFRDAVLPRELVARWVGHESGFTGLLSPRFSASCCRAARSRSIRWPALFSPWAPTPARSSPSSPAWTLIGYTRALVWELPFFGAAFRDLAHRRRAAAADHRRAAGADRGARGLRAIGASSK